MAASQSSTIAPVQLQRIHRPLNPWDHVLGSLPRAASILLSVRGAVDTCKAVLGGEVHSLAQVRAQIDASFGEKDETDRVFKKNAVQSEHGTDHIPKDKLKPALEELHICVSDDQINELFRTMDSNDDGIIDSDEFQQVVSAQSSLEEWAQSLPLAKLLAAALPKSKRTDQDEDPLHRIAELSGQEIGYVCEGFCEGLKMLLEGHVRKLKTAFDTLSKMKVDSTAPKFEVVNLSCGSIDDFHAGLEKRIEGVHLEFKKAIRAEHCVRNGNDFRFSPLNRPTYTTTPKKEWSRIVRGEGDGVTSGDQDTLGCEEEKEDKRVIPNLVDLGKCEIATRSKLTTEEIIAIVMYTGPMYVIYNSILRQHPPEIYKHFKGCDNLFQTTIFVLASGVQKISRVTKLPPGLKLYRGIGGTVDLPDSFFRTDKNGGKGFAEWGFMSTTSEKRIALRYAGNNKSRKIPFVLEIHIGTVDRGACIREFSQYPSENEYLFVPCSFLEQDGPIRLEVTDQDGLIKVFPAKVNANLKTLTVEELVCQKRTVHISGFKYLIEDIARDLRAISTENDKAEERLARDKSKSDTDSVDGFIMRIVQQCKAVLKNHEAVSANDYANDLKFRSLVSEMFDVKMMAKSKLEEWLENDKSSFIRYRWNAELKTVHRRWIAFLTKSLTDCRDPERKKILALRLCQLTGLIVQSVDEVNELHETRLMSLAAEGLSSRLIKMLVDAGADVSRCRPDGVSAIWLAAQFGHINTVRSLIELKAEVNQAATNQATPIYIASQSGNLECIKALAELKADVNHPDNDGLTPAHQAAMNGHLDCLEELHKHSAKLNVKDKKGRTPFDLAREHVNDSSRLQALEKAHKPSWFGVPNPFVRSRSKLAKPSDRGNGKLIISTAQVGDVNGFLALAEYARTEADVVLVVNYPAYLDVSESDPSYADRNPGLGYTRSCKEILERSSSDDLKLLHKYEGANDAEKLKGAMTDMMFFMAKSIWSRDSKAKSKLFFCIGGTNSIDPFSDSKIENDVWLFHKQVSNPFKLESTKEGSIYDLDGKQASIQWEKYSDIYIDFNGSMAYWNENCMRVMSEDERVSKVKGVFIVGGVVAARVAPPDSVKANRFNCATVNQLYHPQHAANFFAFVERHSIPVFVISENEINNVANTVASAFPTHSQLLGEMARREKGDCSPLREALGSDNFHVAIAVKALMGSDSHLLKLHPRRLFYNSAYGLTFVSGETSTWDSTRSEYLKSIETAVKAGDSDPEKTAQKVFENEVETLKRLVALESMPVFAVKFSADAETGKLTIAPPPEKEKEEDQASLKPAEAEGRYDDAIQIPAAEETGNPGGGVAAAMDDGTATAFPFV